MSFLTVRHPQKNSKPHTVIIGIGNEHRRDDGVGLVIARVLKQDPLPQVTVLESTGDGAGLIEAWRDAEQVILIDAVSSEAPPGTIHKLNAAEHPLPADFLSQSSHTLGVSEAIELARILNCLPPHLFFFGIEGEDFSYGSGLSAKVEETVPIVVDNVRKLLPSIIEEFPELVLLRFGG